MYELYETPLGTIYWFSKRSKVVSSAPMYLIESEIYIAHMCLLKIIYVGQKLPPVYYSINSNIIWKNIQELDKIK